MWAAEENLFDVVVLLLVRGANADAASKVDSLQSAMLYFLSFLHSCYYATPTGSAALAINFQCSKNLFSLNLWLDLYICY